ncbi:hypothetical protein EMCRGX_G030757 [Ephydatia muelleri]
MGPQPSQRVYPGAPIQDTFVPQRELHLLDEWEAQTEVAITQRSLPCTHRIDTGVPEHDDQPVFLRKHLASLRVLAL